MVFSYEASTAKSVSKAIYVKKAQSFIQSKGVVFFKVTLQGVWGLNLSRLKEKQTSLVAVFKSSSSYPLWLKALSLKIS